MIKRKQFARKGSAEGGFTLIEVMIAIFVMTIGLLAVMASFATAISATASAQEDLIARHKALDAMESIYTARNSQQLPFSSINNIANGGVFKSGAQQLLCAGPDGLVGTADDVACTAPDTGAACPGGVECLVLPGPDGILGTADDVTQGLGNFRRTITFNPVLQTINGVVSTNLNLIAVTISVSYVKPGWPARTYTVNGLISSYH
ncbi:MAG TPA: prepilin-type N-terminal cleavage/methylation domain-containing protein [Acidobacteriaceae bacterium]|jgi:type IV pilus modification protein PilV|nr:prepilin-type N-terminal cleavage/methylation domain-containing protein [Acidobacteriaceae bacterium]